MVYIKNNYYDEYDESPQDLYEDFYSVKRCLYCGMKLVEGREHYEFLGKDIYTPVWYCPNCG